MRFPDRARGTGAARSRRRHRVAASLLCAAFALAGSASPRGLQQPSQAGELPPLGQEIERSLASGESHEWQVDLAASEFFEIIIEPGAFVLGASDEWPGATVTAPDGAIVYESTAPDLILSI